MKNIVFCQAFFIGTVFFASGQQINGVVYIYAQGSRKTIAGVQISAFGCNTTYSDSNGMFILKCPGKKIGHKLNLIIGNIDNEGRKIEEVDAQQLKWLHIPENPDDSLIEVIVCYEGQREQVLSNLYSISGNQGKEFRAIDKKLDSIIKLQKEVNKLLAQKERDYDLINRKSSKIVELQSKRDAIWQGRERSIIVAAKDLEMSTLQFKKTIENLENRAEISIGNFNYEDAIRCYELIIEKSKKIGVDQLKMASYYYKIANIFFKDSDYKSALNYHQKAIAIQEEILDAKHPSLADSYTDISNTYQVLSQYETALKYQQKAIDIWEAILDSKHPSLATAYNTMALIYQTLGQYINALKYHQKVMSIQEETLASKHLDLATTYNNTGNTYQNLGQYEKALDYYQKTIRIQEEILDSKHPYLASSYGTIALTYKALMHYEIALKYQKKAVAIREKILPPKHPDLGTSYMNIAVTYTVMKDFQRAITSQKKCLTIFKEVLSKDHPYQKKALDVLARIYYDSKNYPKAIATYQEVVKIFSEIKKEDFYSNIGLAYTKNKQFKEAQKAFRKYEKLFPKKGQTYRNWAMYYALQAKKEKALNSLKKAVTLGYANIKWLKTDDSMDSLRNEKAFMQIIGKLEKAQHR